MYNDVKLAIIIIIVGLLLWIGIILLDTVYLPSTHTIDCDELLQIIENKTYVTKYDVAINELIEMECLK